MKLQREPSAARTEPGTILEQWLAGHWRYQHAFTDEGHQFYVFVQASAPETQRGLSLRERQIVVAVADGASNKSVGLELGITESTVASTLRGALGKLGVDKRLELVRLVAIARAAARG